MTPQIILASASPRRKELLAQIGISCAVRPVDIDESPRPNEDPIAYVKRIAAEKSAACAAVNGLDLPILAADTSVVLDGAIFGKPKEIALGFTMLRALSGKTHQVYTAVSLLSEDRGHSEAISMTEVSFRVLSEADIAAYWQTGEPHDKAGAYAIQGKGGLFVSSINGSYSGVVGLPIFETGQLLAQQGIDILR